MNYTSAFLLLGALALLGACQTTPATTADAGSATAAAPTTAADTASSGAPTEAAARAAVGRYVQGLPNASLYQLDSAHALNVDTHWQVLVPRTDWAGRMPNKAAFEVDKLSGQVTTRPVK